MQFCHTILVASRACHVPMAFGKESCGCKGIRTCLVCEGRRTSIHVAKEPVASFYQCHNCGRIPDEENICVDPSAPPLFTCGKSLRCRPTAPALQARCTVKGLPFEGVTVVKEFVSCEEEEKITNDIDRSAWAESQSGRRKQVRPSVWEGSGLGVKGHPISSFPQDYGPKVNFKRQKVKLGNFNGLPPFSKPLIERMHQSVPELCDFVPVEVCTLEYSPKRGSAIDPHLDDEWLWGERLVTLNLLSSTILTFSNPPLTVEVLVPLPRRALMVVSGPARHMWLHSVQRQHIVSRRVGITMRELSCDFLPGGKEEEMGKQVLEIAMDFQGQPINFRK